MENFQKKNLYMCTQAFLENAKFSKETIAYKLFWKFCMMLFVKNKCEFFSLGLVKLTSQSCNVNVSTQSFYIVIVSVSPNTLLRFVRRHVIWLFIAWQRNVRIWRNVLRKQQLDLRQHAAAWPLTSTAYSVSVSRSNRQTLMVMISTRVKRLCRDTRYD